MTTLLGGEWFHKASIFKLGEAAIERAGAEGYAREILDVLDEGVPVFWTAGQAGQDQSAAIRGSSDAVRGHAHLP
jgi:hypothetical protein